MASNVDFRTHVDQSCRYSEEFVNIYYECMDKKRRNLIRLYLDKATLVWNGNAVSGQDALGQFFESLPSSEFQVHTLDCQPVHEHATQGQTTLLVVTAGTVKFDGNKQRFFNQNFLLTAQASPHSDQPVWKIASDCFRFQDWASWMMVLSLLATSLRRPMVWCSVKCAVNIFYLKRENKKEKSKRHLGRCTKCF